MGEEFGEMLRSLREREKVTLAKLANELGISVPYLSDIERGNRGPLNEERLQVAARCLNLSPHDNQLLQQAAAKSRGYFELASTGLNPRKEALGAALARGWPEFEESTVNELSKVLEGLKR